MEHILEMFYDLPSGRIHAPESAFIKAAKIKNEKLEVLHASMTAEQKQWLEAYFDADMEIENCINFDRFCFAFHLGAQLMAEMLRGKETLFK